LRSVSLSHKVTVLAAGGALCLTATGTATAVSWSPSSAGAIARAPAGLPARAATQQAVLTRSLATSSTSRQIAKRMLAHYGWGAGQFSCLDPLWTRESGWNVHARNPRSGAYGIPQALPGRKMASAGPGWRSDPATQIRWGLTYIKGRYGSPCGAWAHERARGWY
jgi:hypothetical protein